jgi:hypothetical protein
MRALPLFQALLHQYHKRVDTDLAARIIPALLQASKFSDQQWKRRAITIVELIRPPSLARHICAYFAYRKSLVLRTNRDLHGAEQAITGYHTEFKQHDGVLDHRLNAIHGYLQHSLAWIAFETGHFQEVLYLSGGWKPLCFNEGSLQPSLYELRAYLKLCTMRGMAMFHVTRYYEASEEFMSALKTYDERSRARQSVLAYTIDAYCECKDLERARMLSNAEFERLELAPSTVQKAHFNDHYLRDVLISTAELYIRLGEYEPAHELLLSAKEYFEGVQVTVQNNQQRHIRVLVLFAQSLHRCASNIKQWGEVLNAWRAVDEVAKKYSIVSLKGWDYALVCLSIYHAGAMLNIACCSWLEVGSENLQADDHFWRYGMRSCWLEFLLEHVSDMPELVKTRIICMLQEEAKNASCQQT